MTVNGNYSSPVNVNGYRCWNCTDVGNAKKHIDPQHPKAGPYGIDAANDPSLRNSAQATSAGATQIPGAPTVLDITV